MPRPAAARTLVSATSFGLNMSAHSALMLAALMIGHHFSASAFWKAPSASGVCWSRRKISWPRLASRRCTLASAKASTTAAFSLMTISLGVRLGAQSANQIEKYNPANPASSIVGISGAAARRLLAVMANALIRPARTCSKASPGDAIIKSTWPATKSCIAGAPPRYGTN